MNLLKRATLCVLCGAMVLSITACDDEGVPAATGDATLPTTTTSAAPAITTTTIDDELENPVDISGIEIDFEAIKLENPRLTYLGNYDMTKAGDIKPAVKFYEAHYAEGFEIPEGEKVITYENVAFDAIQDTLAAKIQADMSPDLVDKQDNTFPHWMSKNLYEDLTPYMDMTLPQWAGIQKYIDRYAWNGKHYYYPWNYDVSPEWLIYNRGLMEEMGLKDPKELYDEGNWTWDTFIDTVNQFVTKSTADYPIGLYGAYPLDNFISSTGTMLIGVGADGLIENNMRSTAVERAALFLEENIRRTGYGRANYSSDFNNVSIEPVVNGFAAFQSMGGWVITNYFRNYPETNTFIVPFPRDPQADEYYMRASSFGYLVPKGSKNVEGACCFINCCRMTITDPELAATTKESLMKNKKYTEEVYDFLNQFKSIENYNAIIDESYCFDKETKDLLQTMLVNVAFDQSAEQQSWTTMREENYGLIQDLIDKYNALITEGRS